ncbi:SgcJ/EcaC family oxidoreductase [Tunicatimonas pelagia]|uniref:SgcJ/EcaC family oxidoreductase n=1 Tax=Tunicatimonas pelagia TaxID=931531 RepID=UPI0026671D28|nr:SgcJ/EcaC family oxidoreductase [Tunicatimonas pelagia]WKN41831.1 SgcJ/EcaC family oxidoreductase [Tunicatimonas pelagia]
MTGYATLDSPEAIPRVFVEAWNQRDARQIARLFDSDGEFVNVTGLWWHRQEDIERAHDYGLRTIFNKSTLTLIRTKTKYLANHIAIVHAKVKLTGQTPTAEVPNPGARHTIFTFVVHQSGEVWSCAAAQNTDIVPAMETHIRDEQNQLHAVDYRRSTR